jgi:4-alpha-glucanotransferase
VNLKRSSGILLHPTSLPGPYGIGSLDSRAYGFVDWLASAGQGLWQVLPLGPTGYGDSPYASFSSFAGNPLLIDLEALRRDGFVSAEELSSSPAFPSGSVDYGWAISWKLPLLERAANRFLDGASPDLLDDFDKFRAREADWLEDFALFMSIKSFYDIKARNEGVGGAMWSNYWPSGLALRDPGSLASWKRDHGREIAIHEVLQFWFYTQWLMLKAYANRKGVEIIGDIPIFVASDSADVWSHRELFMLDKRGQPKAVAGVPPDYFSPTGQLWGNPLYDWKAMAADGYSWWMRRIRSTLALVDWIRIDHFRGFEAFWAVPSGSATAENGKWTKGPGARFFSALRSALGELPILAEDLGLITDEVRALRDEFALPGMKILQFAFDAREGGKGLDVENGFLPHNYVPNCVVYTGSHDNDTMKGWLEKASPAELDFVKRYIGHETDDLTGALMTAALASVAAFAVFPMQDALRLGSEARMNTPSTMGCNWMWRMGEGAASAGLATWLSDTSMIYGRNLARRTGA